jgi:hypothetical protein
MVVCTDAGEVTKVLSKSSKDNQVGGGGHCAALHPTPRTCLLALHPPAHAAPQGHRPEPLYAALRLGVVPEVHNILTLSDGAQHSALRQAVTPCFSSANMKQVGGSWAGASSGRAPRFLGAGRPGWLDQARV